VGKDEGRIQERDVSCAYVVGLKCVHEDMGRRRGEEEKK